MTPRATWSPHRRKRTFLVAGLTALFALLFATSPAAADLTSITTVPANPTTCDSVALVVAGTTPTPCYEIVFTEVNGPVELPTMGPIPNYEIRVRIVLRHVVPPGGACPTVIQPYEKTFAMPMRLRFGTYWVRAVEYLVENGSETPQDSLSSSFPVTSSDACSPGTCVLLGFGRPVDSSAYDTHCHASGPPGGRVSLPITLTNPGPVGGVQTVVIPVHPRDPLAGSVVADSHLVVVPVDVVTTDRTAGFQIAWTAEGDRARVLLYSTTGTVIAPGQGPIFRVIYQVSSHAMEDQIVRLDESIVADPHGQTIPPCPTIASLTYGWGRICIVTPGCDLNEDGASNILDVVQLVSCALSGAGSEACSENAAARADCNGDGSIDVRDVICCVRKILGSGGFGTGDPGGGTGEPVMIGFTGPVRWTTPLYGSVEIGMTPGVDFAGIDFAIDAISSKARISGLRLSSGSGYQLESKVAVDGSWARAMLLATGEGPSSAGGLGRAAVTSATIVVDLIPTFSSGEWGSLTFASTQSANRSALAMPTLVVRGDVSVPELATPVTPSVTAARPNPFRDGTEIAYALTAATRTVLRIYSASGRLVRTLVDSEMPAGVHLARWDGKDSSGRPVSSGIYFFRFSAAEVMKTQRLMLLR